MNPSSNKNTPNARPGMSPMRELKMEEMNSISGGVYQPGKYRNEAIAFLKERLDEKQFSRIMCHSRAQQQPYVAARILLNPADWEKYVWIENHGSLDGFA